MFDRHALVPIVTLLGCLVLFSGCKRSADEAAAPASSQSASKFRALNRDELARELKTGISREDVFKILGNPGSDLQLDETYSRLDYFYTSSVITKTRSDAIAGVTVFLERGRLLRWSPILGPPEISEEPVEIGRSAAPAAGLPNDKDVPLLSCWLVHDSPVTGGRFIDTPRFPKLGHIGPVAALTISNLVSTRAAREIIKGDGNGVDFTNYVVHLAWSPSDALGFARLCSENIGRSIFITVGNKEVSVQKIRFIIASENLSLPVESEAVLQDVQPQFNRLVRTNK